MKRCGRATRICSGLNQRTRSYSSGAFVQRISGWLALSVLLAAVLPAIADDGGQQFADLGRCALDSGETIEHCRVGFRTFGTLNAAGDNAVLMATWLNGRTEDM